MNKTKQHDTLFELREPDYTSGISVAGVALFCGVMSLTVSWYGLAGEIAWDLGALWMLACLFAVTFFFSWLAKTFLTQGYLVTLITYHEEASPFRESALRVMDLHISRRFLGRTDTTVSCAGIKSFEIQQRSNAAAEIVSEVAANYANGARTVLIPEMFSMSDARRFVGQLERHIFS